MNGRSSVYRAFAVVTLLAAVLAAGVAPASASHTFDNMYPTANFGLNCPVQVDVPSFCQTDNAAVSFAWQSSVDAATRDRITAVTDNLDLGTQLTLTRTSSPVYSGAAETDIIYQAYDLPGNLAGMAWCDDAVDGSYTKCDQQYAAFDRPTGPADIAVVCHETGHAVGLTHGIDAAPRVSNAHPDLWCMQTPNTSSTSRYFGPANRHLIDLTY